MAGLLAGHVAAVTGGGSGIGQAIALAYAREGARVTGQVWSLDGGFSTIRPLVK